MAQFVVDLWPLYVTVGGAVIAAGALLPARHAKATWTWPLADAVTTEVSEVEEDEPYEPGDSTVVYHMRVRYAYHVGDAAYQGSHRVYSSGHVWRGSKVPELTRKYEPGKVFQVRYRPDKPGEHSVKGPKNPGVGYGYAFFGAATIIAGVFVAAAGTSLWPVAIGLAAAGAIGAGIRMVAYPRDDVAEGLLFLHDDES